jgi:hypothetical protein
MVFLLYQYGNNHDSWRCAFFRHTEGCFLFGIKNLVLGIQNIIYSILCRSFKEGIIRLENKIQHNRRDCKGAPISPPGFKITCSTP